MDEELSFCPYCRRPAPDGKRAFLRPKEPLTRTEWKIWRALTRSPGYVVADEALLGLLRLRSLEALRIHITKLRHKTGATIRCLAREGYALIPGAGRGTRSP